MGRLEAGDDWLNIETRRRDVRTNPEVRRHRPLSLTRRLSVMCQLTLRRLREIIALAVRTNVSPLRAKPIAVLATSRATDGAPSAWTPTLHLLRVSRLAIFVAAKS